MNVTPAREVIAWKYNQLRGLMLRKVYCRCFGLHVVVICCLLMAAFSGCSCKTDETGNLTQTEAVVKPKPIERISESDSPIIPLPTDKKAVTGIKIAQIDENKQPAPVKPVQTQVDASVNPESPPQDQYADSMLSVEEINTLRNSLRDLYARHDSIFNNEKSRWKEVSRLGVKMPDKISDTEDWNTDLETVQKLLTSIEELREKYLVSLSEVKHPLSAVNASKIRKECEGLNGNIAESVRELTTIVDKWYDVF